VLKLYQVLINKVTIMKMNFSKFLAVLSMLGLSVASFVVFAINPDPNLSLKNEPRPEPPDLMTNYVTDKQALITLGKALFWDMQVGGDGIQACASCHFLAGADNRAKNQITPGFLGANVDASPNPDLTFKAGKGPNYMLKASDFPLHKLADPTNRNSAVLSDTNDVVSSAGVALRKLDRNGTIEISSPVSTNDFGCDIDTSYLEDTTFNVGHANTRRVEPRNTPSVINAVFNHRNFWDGHAQSTFNGVNTKGTFDTEAHLYKADAGLFGHPVATKVQIENSSLASQATAPPGSDTEQGISGRTFLKLGKKLIKCKPLAGQHVAPDDSVLGTLSLYNHLDKKGNHRTGIKKASYKQMIHEAFKPEWWKSTYKIQVNADGTETIVSADTATKKNVYSVEEYNFSLFFGLAVQAYQATLVSDETPWDKFNACDPLSADFTACKSAAMSWQVLNCLTLHVLVVLTAIVVLR
jgi:cytochrome c peroxidase